MNYQQAAERLELLRYSKDLDRLQKTVEDLEAEVRSEGPEHYFRFMLHASNVLSTHDFGDFERQMSLAHKYADAALAAVPEMPLEEEFQALVQLHDDFEDAQAPQQWPEKRRRRVKRWLQALQRLDREMDSNFEIKDLPSIHPVPPPGVRVIPGADSSAVRNPVRRKQYEQALQRNRDNVKAFGMQVKLRELQARFVPLAIEYIAHAYSHPPANSAELEQSLKESKLGPERQSEIVSAARALTGR
jgi:hypothetical protein